MSYPHQPLTISAADGYQLSAMLYPSQLTSSNRFLIIGSAFGVPQQYYKHFAHFLAEQGISCLTFDYRGIGQSKEGSMPAKEILMQHWGELDLEAVIDHVQKHYSPQQLFYLGHSAGGQVAGLAPSSAAFDKMLLAATGVGAWRAWYGVQRYLLAGMWYLALPLMMALQRGDFFKSKLLGPIPVPKHAVAQWVEWAKSRDYLFTPEHGLKLEGYRKIRADILAVTIADDWYAPQSARDALLAHYVNCHRQTRLFLPQDLGLKKIGHFGLFRKKREIVEGIWHPMLNFLTKGSSHDGAR